MKILSSSPVIHVSDFERALDYYTTVLGFTIDFKLEAYAGLLYNEILLYICGPDNDGLKKTPGTAEICFDCDEVDNYLETIRRRGALISYPIGDRYYGIRDFAVDDPDGNTLVFGKNISG
ncbi:VOC family protein [Mucilaginibacter sp. FT3.2]|uniref:VOC family protein n=1 Tax=Mucilaginibacter sp. FT3.2 TaxID=2723090 RepID=UPI001614B352|nr:VOC family protein [Mucilaginibacter sp. FT3.2]MBB6232777.1 catechol 2,3-dioxygenase-like lactoylglutathione lyase family enzyme [Mucilaginibacter sp. FT3.2]